MKHTGKKAFTLIELLVVIAIISILASILFPVFARARENARRSSCLSNLKQIGIGVMMYTQDYDESYPVYQTTESWPSPFGTYSFTPWDGLIQPYVKSFQVFECPSSASPIPSGLNGQYGANEDLLKNANTGSPLTLAGVQSPAGTFMIMDSGTYLVYPTYATAASIGWYYIPGMGDGGGDCSALSAASSTYRSFVQQDCQSGRHFGGVDIAFADGHVKWQKSSVVVSEALKCNGSAGCTTHVSAWNPLLGN